MNSPKDYGEILDGIMPIEKSFKIYTGIIGITFILLPLRSAIKLHL